MELPIQLRSPRIVLSAAVVVALAGAGTWWLTRKPPVSQAGGRYADPALCGQCHGGIAETYAKTGMGRSFRRVRGEKAARSDASSTAKSGNRSTDVRRTAPARAMVAAYES